MMKVKKDAKHVSLNKVDALRMQFLVTHNIALPRQKLNETIEFLNIALSGPYSASKVSLSVKKNRLLWQDFNKICLSSNIYQL